VHATVVLATASASPLVRPYAISGGRTHGRQELGSAAVVRAATAPAWHKGLRPELLAIVLLCRTPSTLAEIAAELAVPLGVVEVLVDELRASGLVTVDQGEDGRYGGRHRAHAA
jgi:Protein of unknown function (DUF742)